MSTNFGGGHHNGTRGRRGSGSDMRGPGGSMSASRLSAIRVSVPLNHPLQVHKRTATWQVILTTAGNLCSRNQPLLVRFSYLVSMDPPD